MMTPRELWLRIKRHVLPYPIAYLMKFSLKCLLLTCRIRVAGLPNITKTAAKQKCILMLWHNRLALIPEVLTRFTKHLNYTGFISNSRDGEPVAILTNSYKQGSTIRVPHDRRQEALQLMITQLKYKKSIIVVTPDGPRGPIYQVKPGVILASQATQAHIVPFTWNATGYWQLKSWDKFMIPKPFSTIHVSFGTPLQSDPSSDLNQEVERLSTALKEEAAKVGVVEA
jgi:hypothetical protein